MNESGRRRAKPCAHCSRGTHYALAATGNPWRLSYSTRRKTPSLSVHNCVFCLGFLVFTTPLALSILGGVVLQRRGVWYWRRPFFKDRQFSFDTEGTKVGRPGTNGGRMVFSARSHNAQPAFGRLVGSLAARLYVRSSLRLYPAHPGNIRSSVNQKNLYAPLLIDTPPCCFGHERKHRACSRCHFPLGAPFAVSSVRQSWLAVAPCSPASFPFARLRLDCCECCGTLQ